MPVCKPGTEIRYDSVTDNAKMYVTYNNSKAYPMYYVIYKKKNYNKSINGMGMGPGWNVKNVIPSTGIYPP